MNQLKKLLPDIVAIVLFAIISVAYFFPAITEGRILAQHDAVAGIGAGREHQEYYEKHGKATRWTNSLFSISIFVLMALRADLYRNMTDFH